MALVALYQLRTLLQFDYKMTWVHTGFSTDYIILYQILHSTNISLIKANSTEHTGVFNITVVKVYFPEEGTIQVHQSQVCSCPPRLPGQRKSLGRLLPWLAKPLSQETEESDKPEQMENVSEDLADSELELGLSDDNE